MGEVKRRRYSSEVRAQGARETRRRILAAAAELFIERGFAATSVAEIARAAGVTKRAVHLIFLSKRAILDEAIGNALGGDDAPLNVRDRDWFRATTDAPAAEMPALFAEFTTALHVRSAALLEVAEAAAATDLEMAVRRERGHQNRRADMRRLAEALAQKTDVDIDYATDMLYTLGSSSVYSLLVFQLGWSSRRYQAWLTAVLQAVLVRRIAAAAGSGSQEA